MAAMRVCHTCQGWLAEAAHKRCRHKSEQAACSLCDDPHSGTAREYAATATGIRAHLLASSAAQLVRAELTVQASAALQEQLPENALSAEEKAFIDMLNEVRPAARKPAGNCDIGVDLLQ